MLKWVVERIEGTADANETAIGNVPTAESLDLEGLDIDDAASAQLLSVDNAAWSTEVDLISDHYDFIGERLPQAMVDELVNLQKRLAN